jgi:hypothetical protein
MSPFILCRGTYLEGQELVKVPCSGTCKGSVVVELAKVPCESDEAEVAKVSCDSEVAELVKVPREQELVKVPCSEESKRILKTRTL